MLPPRRTSTRRAVLSYDQYKDLYKESKPSIVLPNLLVKDYQGILQDFIFTSDEIDSLELRVIENEEGRSNISRECRLIYNVNTYL